MPSTAPLLAPLLLRAARSRGGRLATRLFTNCSTSSAAPLLPASFEAKAVQVRAFGAAEDVMHCDKVQLLPRSDHLQDDGVLVAMAGAGVNPADTYIRSGTYPALPALPYSPGLEGSGTVVAVGPAARGTHGHLQEGAKVCFTTVGADGGHATSSGFYASHSLIKASLVQEVPEGLDLHQAAAVPVAYLTAHRALTHCGRLTKGESVLVRGASGSVGLAAVQLAHHLGAGCVVATASTEEGRQHATALGAAEACGHRRESVQEAMRAVGVEGFDVVIELMGNVNLGDDLELLSPGGRVAVIGSRPGGEPVALDARTLLLKEAVVRGVFLWRQTPAERAAAWAVICTVLATAGPPVKVVPMNTAKQAHRTAAGQATGAVQATQGKTVLSTMCGRWAQDEVLED